MFRLNSKYSNRTTAIETAKSAILKAGQKWKSIKSTTAPYTSLSKRLPKAPPRTNANIYCIFGWNVLYFRIMNALTAAAKIMKNHCACFNKPKAVPVLSTCEIEKKGNNSIEEFSGINFTTNNLVMRSSRKMPIAIAQNFRCFSIFAGMGALPRPYAPIFPNAAKQYPVEL